jgi:hypothetical protein
MRQSDKIYLSKFELDPDSEYIFFDDLDLLYQSDSNEIYDEIVPDNEKNFSTVVRRLQSNED